MKELQLLIAFHPLQVFAAFDVVEPFLVIDVPPYCFCDTGVEGILRSPAKLFLDLVGADGIASIMTQPILDMFNQGIIFSKGLQDRFDNLEIASLIVTADVVNLPVPSFSDNQVNGVAVV